MNTKKTVSVDKEMESVQKQMDDFNAQVSKKATNEVVREASKVEHDPQTKLSKKEIANSGFYLKRLRSIGSAEPFNERFREQWEFSKEIVKFICENKEIQGEAIDVWTKPYAGLPAEEWIVPVNTPVYGPRYVAEQIRRKYYKRLVMKEEIVESGSIGQIYGKLIQDTSVNRFTCEPVNNSISVFMGV